jgi:hypothetical protein
MSSAVRSASAERVSVGLAVPPVGNVPLPKVQVVMVMGALERIDHRRPRVVAHAVRSHHVAGADVGERDRLAIDHLVETARTAACRIGRTMGEIRRTQFIEDKFSQAVGGDDALSRIIRNIVGYFRTRQPQAIAEFGRQLYPVVRIRILLDQESDPELSRDQIIQFAGEVSAKQRGIILAELAELLLVQAAQIHAVDEIDGCDMGIGPELGPRDHEIPAFIADVDAKRGALGAERAIAEIADPRGDQRATIGKHRLCRRRQQRPGDIIRVIHQVASDHVAAVRHTLAGSAIVLRHQQQPRRLDGVRRDDVDFCLDTTFAGFRSGLFLVGDIVDLADASVLDNDFIGDRVIDEVRASVGRLVQGNRRIIFGLDRADRNAIGIAGAGAAIPVGLGIARGRQASHLDLGDGLRHFEKFGLVVRQLRERIADALIEQRPRNPRHRIGMVLRKRDIEKALLLGIG